MAKVTFILGLCASGKTYQAKKLAKIETALLIDEGLNPYVNPPFGKLYKKLIDSLKKGRNVVAIEIALCDVSIRSKLVSFIETDASDAEIKWVCIENDLNQANKNIEYRISKGEKGSPGHYDINERVSRIYTYPDGAEIIQTFNPGIK